jgi:hypothetical protein
MTEGHEERGNSRAAIRQLVKREPTANAAAIRLSCPRCGLTITPKVDWLTVEHCPRCIARARTVVGMFASTLPTDEPYSSQQESSPSATAVLQSAGRQRASQKVIDHHTVGAPSPLPGAEASQIPS